MFKLVPEQSYWVSLLPKEGVEQIGEFEILIQTESRMLAINMNSSTSSLYYKGVFVAKEDDKTAYILIRTNKTSMNSLKGVLVTNGF